MSRNNYNDALEAAMRAAHSVMEGSEPGAVMFFLREAERNCCDRLGRYLQEHPLDDFETDIALHQQGAVISVLIEAARDSLLGRAKEGIGEPSLGGY